jgi:hypothetical protein
MYTHIELLLLRAVCLESITTRTGIAMQCSSVLFVQDSSGAQSDHVLPLLLLLHTERTQQQHSCAAGALQQHP